MHGWNAVLDAVFRVCFSRPGSAASHASLALPSVGTAALGRHKRGLRISAVRQAVRSDSRPRARSADAPASTAALRSSCAAGSSPRARRLRSVYAPDSLGNQAEPLDELVFIMLSRRTQDRQYRVGYAALGKAFPRWQALLDAPRTRGSISASGGSTVTRFVLLERCMLEQRNAVIQRQLCQQFYCGVRRCAKPFVVSRRGRAD